MVCSTYTITIILYFFQCKIRCLEDDSIFVWNWQNIIISSHHAIYLNTSIEKKISNISPLILSIPNPNKLVKSNIFRKWNSLVYITNIFLFLVHFSLGFQLHSPISLNVLFHFARGKEIHARNVSEREAK